VSELRAVCGQVVIDPLSFEKYMPPGRLDETNHHLHGGRFPRAVRPQISDHLTLVQHKAYVPHSRDAPKALPHVTEFQHACPPFQHACPPVCHTYVAYYL